MSDGNGSPKEAAGGVQSVRKGLRLLEVLASAGGSVGVTKLGELTGLPYATIHRLLATLANEGYVTQAQDSRQYLLGPRLVWLGQEANKLYTHWLEPYLRELVAVSGESANLAVLQGDHAVYVVQVPSEKTVRMFTEAGNRVMLHNTGVGKVLLASQRPEVVERVIERQGLPAKTEHTITNPDVFRKHLDEVREQGYALDSEETEIGVRCIAVPVHGIHGNVAAMSISGPLARLSPEVYERVLPEMQRLSQDITQFFQAQAA